MIKLKCALALILVILIGCQEKIQSQEPVLSLQDGVIVRKIETGESSRHSEYYYLRDGSYELVRGWKIFKRKAPPDYNPTTGSLDPYIDYTKIVKIVNTNDIETKNVISLICSISVDEDEGDSYNIVYSHDGLEDIIRNSTNKRLTHNNSYIVDIDSLSFSDKGPYCWLSADGLFEVSVQESEGRVTDIRTTHLGFLGVENNIAVTAPVVED
jgi:hypothetical protein